jgi:hypothetical protein
MNVRLAKVDDHALLLCLRHAVWGSRSNRFGRWERGDRLVFVVNRAVAGVAQVEGEPTYSERSIWRGGLYPYRLPIQFLHLMLPGHRPPLRGEIGEILVSAWGRTYGWGIRSQQPLPQGSAKSVLRMIAKATNDLPEITADLARYLEEAQKLGGANIAGGEKSGPVGSRP